MKRRCLFLVLCLMSFTVFCHATSVGFQATVGVPFTIDPVVDVGAGTHSQVRSMNGFRVTNNTSATYTPTAFTYTVSSYNGNKYVLGYVNGNPHYAQGIGHVYTITPVTAGVINFSIIFSAIIADAVTSFTVDYTIYVVDVTNISLPEDLNLIIGENFTMSPVITNSMAKTTLAWLSSDTSVATVDNDGNVAAVGAGTATITCTAHNGVSGQSVVTVKPTYIQNIDLNETDCELSVGEKFQLETTIFPESATIKELTWSSTNEAVAMVSESGRIIAISPGVCQIKATSNDGSGKSASCIVNVKKEAPLGDMNGDGVLSVTDVVKLINQILQQ